MHTSFLKLFVLALFALALSIGVLSYIYQSAAAADSTVSLNQAELSSDSGVTIRNRRKVFSIRGKKGEFYRTKAPGASGVYEFLSKTIRVNNGQQLELSNLPQELDPKKVIDDRDDPVLRRAGHAANRKHYFFKQKAGGLDVFGSSIIVHVKDENQVYDMSGALLEDKTVQKEGISENQARDIALQIVPGGRARVVESRKVAVNPEFVGLSDDTKTYPALVVITNQMIGEVADPRRTIVSLTDGSIISTIEYADYVMDRRVFDCQENPNGSCTLRRQEGGAATGNAEVDNMYTFLGDAYDFYRSRMNRDSYDNKGGIMKSFVNLPAEMNGTKLCPNARWLRAGAGSENQLQTCPGWGTKDVVAHELTHGVVEYSADLDPLNQAGALNEAIADTFAVGIDDDWLIGEDLSGGAIRNLAEPGQNRTPGPDRLFSTRYHCSTSDRGGVHVNMTIPTKAFYLAVTGGTFNNCTMTGIGKEKALLIWYQALTKYLNTNSNFRNLYDGIVQGCTDLYGAASNECIQVKKATQAVEMDQQPLGTQSGPRCSNVSAKPATCVGATNPPATATVQPQATNTPAVTGGSCTNNARGDANHDGSISVADFNAWRSAYLSK